MDEKSKSIWKKSLNLPRLFFAWLILSTATFAVIVVLGELTGTVHDWPARWRALFETLMASLIVATVALALWLFIRWLCNWRNFKKFLFGCACLATLIALFYAEEDWRGKHDWEKFKREWEAKGEKFDFKDFVPTPVADDQNFAFSPVWIAEEKFLFQNRIARAKAWYGDQIDSEAISKLFSLMPVSVSGLVGTNNWWLYHLPNPPEVSTDWATSQFTDLKLWQSYYRNLESTNPSANIPIAPQPQSPAQDVLLALSKFDPAIGELQKDSALPYSRFPIQYDGMPAAILLPHLAAEKRYAVVLQFRAIAELQNGQSEKALDDVKLTLRLADASRAEPFLISHLVRYAILHLSLQPIYEGLAGHKWSDAQLADLDSELAKLNFFTDYEFTVRGERALCLANIEFLQHPHDVDFKRPRLYFLVPFLSLIQMLEYFSDDGENSAINFQTWALSIGPSGWLNQNKICVAQFETKWYLPIVDDNTKIISPVKARAADNAVHSEIEHRTPENVLETLLMPSFGDTAEKSAYAQSSVNLARTAIALERYRLTNGNYPDSLDALTPQFIAQVPHDVIGGQPLHYRLTNDGQFILYSVGWNGRDDGGVVVLKNKSPGDESSSSMDMDQGDWVWRYPAR